MAHPTDAELRRFAAAELEPAEAVAIARHVDACPRCGARAAVLDPLSVAWAACDDPPPPPGLVEAALAAAAAPPPPTARPETFAFGLFAAGLAVFLLAGDPVGAAVHAAATARALAAALAALPLPGTALPPLAWPAAGALLLLAATAWVRGLAARQP